MTYCKGYNSRTRSGRIRCFLAGLILGLIVMRAGNYMYEIYHPCFSDRALDQAIADRFKDEE